MTDDQARNVQQYEYDSFGNQHDMKNRIKQPYGYTGREHDRETGLRYYRARYYDGEVGRFISEDPIGFFGGINQYVYVGNRPIRFVDPSGLIDIYANIEADFFAVIGFEGSVGFVIDTDNPGDSGVFGAVGFGTGVNFGIGGGAGFADELEGEAASIDVNVPTVFPMSPTFLFDEYGFAGGQVTAGVGLGVSASSSYTWTYSWSDLVDDVSYMYNTLTDFQRETRCHQ